MSDEYAYYAAYSFPRSGKELTGVLRHKPHKDHPRAGTDEIFSRDGGWHETSCFREHQWGQGDHDFEEIDEAEANRLVEYFKGEQERIARERQQ
jgi:hypothetical protein